jgi:hypothetical protein
MTLPNVISNLSAGQTSLDDSYLANRGITGSLRDAWYGGNSFNAAHPDTYGSGSGTSAMMPELMQGLYTMNTQVGNTAGAANMGSWLRGQGYDPNRYITDGMVGNTSGGAYGNSNGQAITYNPNGSSMADKLMIGGQSWSSLHPSIPSPTQATATSTPTMFHGQPMTPEVQAQAAAARAARAPMLAQQRAFRQAQHAGQGNLQTMTGQLQNHNTNPHPPVSVHQEVDSLQDMPLVSLQVIRLHRQSTEQPQGYGTPGFGQSTGYATGQSSPSNGYTPITMPPLTTPIMPSQGYTPISMPPLTTPTMTPSGSVGGNGGPRPPGFEGGPSLYGQPNRMHPNGQPYQFHPLDPRHPNNRGLGQTISGMTNGAMGY